MGGVALLALLFVLGCLMRRRSKAKKAASPFPADEDEKGPPVIAGLPPNPSSTQLRPTSGNYSNSIVMTDAASALPLLGTDMSMHSGSITNAALVSDARSSHMHRPSTTSLAPSFIMGSSASFQHSHGSHYGQPLLGAHPNTQDSAAAPFAGGYPDVHRTAYYEPYMPPGVDPRAVSPSAVAVGSAAAAYHAGGAMAGIPGSTSGMMDARAPAAGPGVSSLPMGAGPSDYAAASEAARLRGVPQGAYRGDAAWSGSASLNDGSSRRGSHGSTLAMLPAASHLSEASAHSQGEADNLQHRRPPAAGFPGHSSHLNTIPGSVAVSEVASGDHHSMQSAAYTNRTDLSLPPKLPSIPASSPLILQDATSFAPQGSMAAGAAALPAALSAASPRLTAEPGTGTLQSNDPSTGTYNSDGTYNTYTGAVKGQLRVVGSADAHGQGPSTIPEEGAHPHPPRRDMSGDSKNGEFWVDASEPPKLGAAGKRLGQHTSNDSTSSINKTGSRMIEMLDTDEQPEVPISVTGPDEPPKPAAPPSRPAFWKERSKSSQSISKVFRNSPRATAHGSPASGANAARMSGTDSPRSGMPSRAAEPEQLPPLDLGRSVTSSAQQSTESPKADADADMWKASSKAKPSSAMRKWTKKRSSKNDTKGADNEVDIDQLFS